MLRRKLVRRRSLYGVSVACMMLYFSDAVDTNNVVRIKISVHRIWKIEYFRNFTVKTDKPGAYVLELFSCVGYLQTSSNISLLYSLFSFT